MSDDTDDTADAADDTADATDNTADATDIDEPRLEALPLGSLDALAGVVDLFGALTRAEVVDACEELAYRRGETVAPSAVEAALEAAVDRYYLVECDGVVTADAGGEPAGGGGRESEDRSDETGDETDGERPSGDGDAPRFFAVGPVAFPTLPPNAEDLPHILEFPTRAVDVDALARDVEERLRGDAARAVAGDDHARMEHLLDVTYDLEAWASLDVGEVRDRLDRSLQR